MLDPQHIHLTRMIVEILVGIPVLWITICFVVVTMTRRGGRRGG